MASYHHDHSQARKLRIFSPVNPHFRKRISTITLLDNKLRIPAEFMRKYGRTLSDLVVIKVPSGAEWEIRLTKYDGDTWFEKGWLEFAKHYSLEDGQALLFKYKGCSQFDVVIIDKNGLEIDYPIIHSTPFNESDIDVSDDDDVSPCLKTEEKSTRPFCHTRKRMKGNPGDAHPQCDSDEMNSENPMSKGDYSHNSESKDVEEVENYEADHQVSERKQRSLSKGERLEALSRTKDFTSQNPHCKVVLQKVNLYYRFDMALPTRFWMAHVFEKTGDAKSQKSIKTGVQANHVTLCASHGRTWPVQLNVRTLGAKPRRVSFLKRGWKEFAEDNNLKIGDVCIFELIDKKEILFKVTVNRARDDQNNQVSQAGKSAFNQDQPKNSLSGRSKIPATSYRPKTCHMQSPIDHIAEEGSKDHRQEEISFEPGIKSGSWKSKDQTSGQSQTTEMPPTSTNPRFRVELRQCSLQKLHVPQCFAAKHFKAETQSVKLKVGKEIWKLKMLYSDDQYIFSDGWPEFVTDNRLRQGMFSEFELLKRESRDRIIFLEVTIS